MVSGLRFSQPLPTYQVRIFRYKIFHLLGNHMNILGCTVFLNVGGTIHQVKWETIDKFPKSRLQRLRFATTESKFEFSWSSKHCNLLKVKFSQCATHIVQPSVSISLIGVLGYLRTFLVCIAKENSTWLSLFVRETSLVSWSTGDSLLFILSLVVLTPSREHPGCYPLWTMEWILKMT